MAHVSLRVTEKEKAWMESYAGVLGVPLSEAIKIAFFEKMEDDYDLKIIAEYEKHPGKSYTFAEALKELELENEL